MKMGDFELVIRPNRFEDLAVIPTDLKANMEHSLSRLVPPRAKEAPTGQNPLALGLASQRRVRESPF